MIKVTETLSIMEDEINNTKNKKIKWSISKYKELLSSNIMISNINDLIELKKIKNKCDLKLYSLLNEVSIIYNLISIYEKLFEELSNTHNLDIDTIINEKKHIKRICLDYMSIWLQLWILLYNIKNNYDIELTANWEEYVMIVEAFN